MVSLGPETGQSGMGNPRQAADWELLCLPLGARGPFWLVLSSGGAAERSGVPPGARLLEVNGVSVEKLTSNQLSRKVGLLPAVASDMNAVPRGSACVAPLFFSIVCVRPALIPGPGGRRLSIPTQMAMLILSLGPHSFGRVEIR